MILIAAALTVVACDSSEPGIEPGPITATDASDPGKVDDPNQPDTYNTADTGTAQNDAFTPPLTAEELCGELLDLQGVWWCESDNQLIDGDRLDVTVQVSAAGDQCEITFACDGCSSWNFVGKTLPLSTQYKNGIYDWTTKIFTEGDALIREDTRADRPDAPMRIEFYR